MHYNIALGEDVCVISVFDDEDNLIAQGEAANIGLAHALVKRVVLEGVEILTPSTPAKKKGR